MYFLLIIDEKAPELPAEKPFKAAESGWSSNKLLFISLASFARFSSELQDFQRFPTEGKYKYPRFQVPRAQREERYKFKCVNSH